MSTKLAHAPVLDPSPAGDLAPQVAAVLRRLRKLGLRVPHPGEVQEYLLAYPDTIPALAGIGEVAAARLGDHAQLSLELYRDFETADQYLSIYARQAEYQDDLMDEIDGAREEYEPYLRDVSGWILLTTDFRPVAA
jgi:hypothetical protein